MTRYYWDSCVFISRLQGDPDRIVALEYLTDEAAAGRIQLITSTLAIAEVCYLKKECSEEQLRHDIEEISRFFSNDYIHLVQVTQRIATEAAHIARKHGVKPPDAIHLATAILNQCDAVHTYDGVKMLKLDKLIGDPPLRIIQPNPEVQADLFSNEKSAEADDPDPALNSLVLWPPRRYRSAVYRGDWATPTRRIWGRSALVG